MSEILTFNAVKNSSLSDETKLLLKESLSQKEMKPLSSNLCGITALYERLSSEDNLDGESNSIANQKRILERYCDDKGYQNIVHYDEDDGYSGTNFNRPGFQRMLADIKAGKVSRVLVKDMSRLGRDYLQVGLYTDVVFPEYDVHFIAVNDGVDSTKGENEFTAIRNVFNEMYARDCSKKIKASYQIKGRNGEHLAGIAPYGYLKDPGDKSKWIIDEEAAAIVQKIFELCIAGNGLTKIKNWLVENKVKCPSHHRRDIGVGTTKISDNPYGWTEMCIGQILERLEYLGHTVNFKTEKKSYKSKRQVKTNPNDWAIFENTHPAIIDEATFQTVQNLRKNKRRPTRMGDTGKFSGLIRCGHCGSKMYLCRRYNMENQDYYACSMYRKDRSKCKQSNIIRVSALEEIISESLRTMIDYVLNNQKTFIQEMMELSKKDMDKDTARKKKTVKKNQSRIDKIDEIIKKLYLDNFEGKISDSRFKALAQDFEVEQSKIKEENELLLAELSLTKDKEIDVNKFISLVKKYGDSKELTAAFLNDLIEYIEVFPKDKITKQREVIIHYNFIGPYQL